MTTYTTIPNASLDVGKPVRSIDALALRDNPIAIAERASGAPWLNGIGAITVLDTVGAGTYTVPDGVTRIKVHCYGGGAGYRAQISAQAIAGGNTTFSHPSQTLTANGASGGSTYSGGGASGGIVNIEGDGGGGKQRNMSKSNGAFGCAGKLGSSSTATATNGNFPGGGAHYSDNPSAPEGFSGGAGGYCMRIFEVTPGQEIAYVIGNGGQSTGTPFGGNGSKGAIFIEY